MSCGAANKIEALTACMNDEILIKLLKTISKKIDEFNFKLYRNYKVCFKKIVWQKKFQLFSISHLMHHEKKVVPGENLF